MKKLPPLNAIRVFEAVARNMSFTAAAQELNITTTAVSHQIRQLEEIAGTKLFNRNSRTISLSQIGERLYPGLQEGLDKIADAFSELEERRASDVVTVTTTRSFAENWLLPRLRHFYAAAPGITVNLDASDVSVDMRSSDADLAIRYGPVMRGDERIISLFEDEYIPVCHRSICPNPGSSSFSSLDGLPLLSYRWTNQSLKGPTWSTWLERTGLDKSAYRVNWLSEEGLAIQAMMYGLGLLLCSDVLVRERLREKTCVRIDGPALPGFGFRLVVAPSAARKKVVKRFTEWLLSEATQFGNS